MRSTGTLLRGARESFGISIEEAAESLCIGHRYIRALEEDAHDDIPGPTYVIGYLRSYAQYLGLDPEPMLKRYRDGFEPAPLKYYPTPEPTTAKCQPTLVAYGISVLLLVMLYGSWYITSHRAGQPYSFIVAPEAHVKQAATP